MAQIIDRKSIEQIILQANQENLLKYIEQSFIAYSSGASVVPPVGTLNFDTPPADVHIKYGYIKEDEYYVIKIASGFYNNPNIGLPSSNGLNLVFNQTTGILETILMDEGYLTDVRTALAGAVVAKHFAPSEVQKIGIMGTGIQARLQLKYLKNVINCRKVLVWGRSMEKLQIYKEEMEKEGFEIECTLENYQIGRECQLIVTTTPAKEPILFAQNLQNDVLITAMGADTIGKQELDPAILLKADQILVDSYSQCRDHGEIHKAYNQDLISDKALLEVGLAVSKEQNLDSNKGIVVADLTGIATQDIQISKFVLDQLK